MREDKGVPNTLSIYNLYAIRSFLRWSAENLNAEVSFAKKKKKKRKESAAAINGTRVLVTSVGIQIVALQDKYIFMEE